MLLLYFTYIRARTIESGFSYPFFVEEIEVNQYIYDDDMYLFFGISDCFRFVRIFVVY